MIRAEERPLTETTAMPGERLLSPAGIGLPELETFIAVAELGSFSLAAKRLNLSQPAVTARVQKLESTLGTRLLHRTTRSVEVSEAGRRLMGEAGRVLHDLRALISEFREASVQKGQGQPLS